MGMDKQDGYQACHFRVEGKPVTARFLLKLASASTRVNSARSLRSLIHDRLAEHTRLFESALQQTDRTLATDT